MGLDNQGSQPLYKQLEEKIIQDIENGIYRKGQKIPTEKELSQMYDVSRITVRKALEEITKQGILERQCRKGHLCCICEAAEIDCYFYEFYGVL